jgi:hypothetical protein
MKVLFDQGTPAPLRLHLTGHHVRTAHEMNWSNLKNGELLRAAENEFDALVTTDRNLRYQQNLQGRRLALLVLPTTSWPRLKEASRLILDALNQLQPGDYREVVIDARP